MKKFFMVILTVLLCAACLSGCGCQHEWVEANCTTPKTCTLCQETEGTALGHSGTEADCENPKTCTLCGLTEGEPLGHIWEEATCTQAKTCSSCAATEGEALGHSYDNWTILDDVQMTANCQTCYAADTREIDRKRIADTRLIGTWESDTIASGGSEVMFPGLYYVFHEDNTFENWYAEEPDKIYSGTWEYVSYEYKEASNPDLAPFEYYYISMTMDEGSYLVILNCRESYYLYNLVEFADEEGTVLVFYDKQEETAGETE